ncbi:MAG: plasmid pRiA4b ORF-3 family protein [Lachnospiraceae bacterium]|nr:plasmid pRiA4b ORF-3 family protein [Lachnospiraceae bacterium]
MRRTYIPSEAMNSSQDLSVETSLGELELCQGQTFTYLFDFGDMWQFTIKVLEIRDGTVKKPEVISAVGDAPEQYPYCEEYEEWRAEISEQVQAGSGKRSVCFENKSRWKI